MDLCAQMFARAHVSKYVDVRVRAFVSAYLLMCVCVCVCACVCVCVCTCQASLSVIKMTVHKVCMYIYTNIHIYIYLYIYMYIYICIYIYIYMLQSKGFAIPTLSDLLEPQHISPMKENGTATLMYMHVYMCLQYM